MKIDINLYKTIYMHLGAILYIYVYTTCVCVHTYSAPTTTAVKPYLTPINHVPGLFCIIYFIMGHCLRAVVSYTYSYACVCIVRVCVCVLQSIVAVVRRLYDDGDRTGRELLPPVSESTLFPHPPLKPSRRRSHPAKIYTPI